MEFHRLGIYGIKNLGDRYVEVDDDHADFWSLYGFVSAVNGSEFAICIGDSESRAQAELVRDMLGY